ncbi:hypothetical protein ACLFLN_12215 [Acinetobacter pittii]
MVISVLVEQNVNGEVKDFHKPIMIAGGYGNIRPDHVEKDAIQPGDLLHCIGWPCNVNRSWWWCWQNFFC